MFTIELNKLLFTAYHGVHPDEKNLGNTYEVDVSLSTHVVEVVTELSQTIDYVTVYDVIRKRMAIPTPLLETVAQDLAHEICALDQRIKSISVSIKKRSAPIQGMEGTVGVSYKKEF